MATEKQKIMRKNRFMQFAYLWLIIVGAILSRGREFTFEAIFGIIMVAIGALYWTFQDDIKFAKRGKEE